MATNDAKYTLGQLADRVEGRLVGDRDTVIARPVAAGSSDPEGITFASNDEFLKLAISVPIGAIVINEDLEAPSTPHIVVRNARAAFGTIIELFVIAIDVEPGISPLASIHPTAVVSPSARIAPFAVIGRQSEIGDDVRVHSHAYVGALCKIGAKTVLNPNSTLIQNVHMGESCFIHSGVVIGSDGFGFEISGDDIVKIPQLGGVRIGDNVEIGANSCVDRGALDNTVIGNNVKIDNLCQIGHNVQIGANTIIAGTVGIGGSVKIGERVLIGANAGIKDHVEITDDVSIGVRSGVMSDITEPGEYLGMPVQPLQEGMRVLKLSTKLPEIWSRLRAIEQNIASEIEP